jgi:ribonuclease E
MKNLMPTHVKKVTEHTDAVSHLFQAYKVENMLTEMHNPEVTLKSGGYIVINQTEALVAIDVNSGKATRERNIEETALRTNLEAAVEIARQLKLRDLSGLVVIDFIDMDYSRNKNAVERKLKEAMKHDRARVQVGSISQFGLLEMSRQRLRPSLSEAVSDLCPHCHGTGRIRSVESAALAVIHQIEGEVARKPRAKLTVAMASEVALYILNHKRDAISELETRFQMSIILEQDNSLLAPHIRFEGMPEKQAQPDRKKAKPEPKDIPDTAASNPVEQAVSSDDDDDDENKPKRRRRRGKRGGRNRNRRDQQNGENNAEANSVLSGAEGEDTAPSSDDKATNPADQTSEISGDHSDAAKAAEGESKPAKKPARRRGRKPAAKVSDGEGSVDNAEAPEATAPEATASESTEEKPKPTRRRKAASPKPDAAKDAKPAETAEASSADTGVPSAPAKKPRSRKPKAENNTPDTSTETADAATKPKRGRKKQDASPADTTRDATVSADINVVDVSTVSTETKKKGWWSR